MKNLVFALILILACGVLAAQAPEPDSQFPAARRDWLLSQSTRYHYNNGWQPYTLENYGYNTQGQLDLLSRHLFSVEATWDLSSARDYVYNTAGQIYETVYYFINDGVWSAWHRESNTYDTAGNLDQVFYYQGYEGEWALLLQQVNSYEQGLLANEHIYSYDSLEGAFSDYEDKTYIYNAECQLLEKLVLTVVEQQGLTQSMRCLYSYNPDGSLAQTLYQFWSWIGDHYAWRDSRRDINTFDTHGFLTEVLEQNYSDTIGWNDTTRYTYTNDWFGNAVQVDKQLNSMDGWQDWDHWINVYASTSVEDDQIPAPNTQISCRPNPFSASTEISFQLKEAALAELAVYNLKGQKVMTLAGGTLSAGAQTYIWNGKDAADRDLPAGIYLLRLSIPGQNPVVKRITRY